MVERTWGRPILVCDGPITKIWAKALYSSLLLIYTLSLKKITFLARFKNELGSNHTTFILDNIR